MVGNCRNFQSRSLFRETERSERSDVSGKEIWKVVWRRVNYERVSWERDMRSFSRGYGGKSLFYLFIGISPLIFTSSSRFSKIICRDLWRREGKVFYTKGWSYKALENGEKEEFHVISGRWIILYCFSQRASWQITYHVELLCTPKKPERVFFAFNPSSFILLIPVIFIDHASPFPTFSHSNTNMTQEAVRWNMIHES